MASILSIEEAKSASIRITEGDKGKHAIWQSVVAIQTNRRAGTASTKTRNEVAGSGKKLWRQKGTGNARMGSRRSPVWRGGGVVWGPRPRVYHKKVNRKMETLSIAAAFTSRIHDGDVLRIGDFSIADGKTKSFMTELRKITDAKKVVILGEFDKATLLSARNVEDVELMSANEIDTEDLLWFDKIVLAAGAMETLAKRTAND